jgi:rhodanese-related sulfurtransferase/glyoxylase-like metal-dependent hydrolase (beta-lactamase superfamily II)
LPLLAGAATLKDAESASHGDEAADYQVVKVYSYPGYRLVQFNLAVLSHYSYLLVSGKEALVVDPGRDVAAYLEWCRKEGVKITGVLLTHNHADFVAGHLEVAKSASCPVYISAQSGAAFPHQGLKEGSTLKVGEALVKIIETPGHTPEGVCGLVANRAKPSEPHLLLTGDTLFIGSVGRPDLMGGSVSAAALAGMLFDTWTNKLSKLPDHLDIFPAHGAGSLCGAHLSDEPTATLGSQRQANPYLKYRHKSEFITAVLEGLPEAPQYFKHNAALNKKGPDLVAWQAGPAMLKPEASLADFQKVQVVDLREARDYAAGHIPGSLNIAVRGRLETWVGTMVPWGGRVVVCGGSEQVAEAWRRLHRVGYAVQGVNFADWQKAGLPLAKTGLIKPKELHAQMHQGEAPVIVDVRLPQEWMGLRIGMVVNLPLNRLAELAPAKLDKEQRVVTVCNSAFRSSLAVGVLERLGFRKVASLDGGSEAWLEAGLPTLGAEAAPVAQAAVPAPAPAKAPRREIRLPERLAPAELKRLLVDLPGTFELVDLRPPAAFADYHLPGAVNVDLEEAIKNPAFLSGPGPLILVDRDGSLAMAVGGILSQKTARSIKVLHGGLAAYWQETEFPSAVGAPGDVAPAPGPAPPAAPAAPPPAAPKKKSAGC